MDKCIYCNKECKNNNSKRNHERLCKLNPDRQQTHFQGDYNKNRKPTNQFIKAVEEGLPKPVVSDETRQILREKLTGKKMHSQEYKNKMSKLAKERNFGGVRKSKKILYNGKLLGSTYELAVVESLDKHNIKWDICGQFEYIDPNGKSRRYTPDIYLIDYDIYLDPKNDFLINNNNPVLGYKDVDKIKLVEEQNGIKIIILNKDELTWEVIKNKIGAH